MNEKLKTLEDFDCIQSYSLGKIREVAIAWLKWFDGEEEEEEEFEGKNINYWLDTPNWLEYFFNITDKDLKGDVQ